MPVTRYVQRNAFAPTNTAVLTDAAFRAFGQAVNAALTGIGLVQTADTGQINWTTITAPTVNNTLASGVEMWRFSDALQSTNPVFMQIGYGRGAGTTANAFLLRIKIGAGSDGAGNLTGAYVDTNTLNIYLSNDIVASTPFYDFLGFGDPEDGSYGIQIVRSAADTAPGGFAFERTRNPITLAPTGEGVHITYSNNTAFYVRTFDFAANGDGGLGFQQSVFTPIPTGTQYLNDGRVVISMSNFLSRGVLSPSTVWATYKTGQIPLGSIVTVTPRDGKQRLYRATGRIYYNAIYMNDQGSLQRVG